MTIKVNEKGELIVPNNKISENIRCDAMNEIISRKTGFLGKWALLIYLLLITLIISGTWLIHYPDVIKTRAILIATNAPRDVFSRQDGRLLKLFVQNSQMVSSGDILAFIESNAKHEHIIKLNRLVDSTIDDLEKNNTKFIVSRFSITFEQLGELQMGYQQFISSYQQFIDYVDNGFYLKKKEILRDDLVYVIKK